MKDGIKKLAYPLILAGSFLEVFYVSVRYSKDGIPMWICIIIGVSLNLFLMLAAYKEKTGLVFLLIAFSILNTSSGQTLSLLKKENAEKNTGISASESQNNRYVNEIEQLEKEIKEIDVRLSGFDTMEKKAEYKNNIRDDEQFIKDKRAEQARLEQLITENENKIDEKSKNSVEATSIYTFYGSIPKWDAVDWFTFGLHTVLSFFIALMAPFGISVLKKEAVLETGEAERKLTAQEWVLLVWRGVDIKKPYVPSLHVMEEYCKLLNIPWDDEAKNLHQMCLDACNRNKLFSDGNKIIGDKQEAIRILCGTA
jgi:hypothetical protein